MKKATFIVATIATLSVLALAFVSQEIWPAYQVHRQSQAALEACGKGQVWRVEAEGFKCKPEKANI